MKNLHKRRMDTSINYRNEFHQAVEQAIRRFRFYVLVTTNMHGGTDVRVFRTYRQASSAAVEFLGRPWARCFGDSPKPHGWSEMLTELSQHEGFKEDVILHEYRAVGQEFEKVDG